VRSGVSATIISDTGGARLVISSSDTGSKNAIKIESPAIASIAFDPAALVIQAVSRLQSAQDARISVDNSDIVSASNQISGAIDVLTLNLTKAKPGQQTELRVAQDSTSAKQVLGQFVNSYNGLNAMAHGYTKYDATTKARGVLQGEVTAVSLMNQLRTTISSAIPGAVGDFKRLSDIGISMQADGSLKLDDTKLAAVTSTASATAQLARMFIATPSNPDTFVTRIMSFVTKMQGTGGIIPSKADGLTTTITRLDKQQEAINARLVGVEARLRKQFNALDSQLASQNAVSAYLTSQVMIWSNATK
jgi:flagellar hook-associated protein 2